MATKTRNWKFIVWQESAPDDFVKRMADSFMKVNMCLHDKDVHDDGTPVKPHWDGVILLDGPVTYDNIFSIMKRIAGDGINTIQECITTAGALKYVCHLGNTAFNEDSEKYQYDVSEVISLNGAEYVRDILRYEEPDKYDDEILTFIEKNNITQYRDLVLISKRYYPTWYRSISTRTLFWKGYLTSKEDKQAHSVTTIYDNALREELGIEY